jgi:hypothetical protein
MDMSGRLHAPAALPLEKQPLGGWMGPRAGLDMVVKRKGPSPCRESNPDRPAHSLVAIPNELPRFLNVVKVNMKSVNVEKNANKQSPTGARIIM